MLKFPRLSAFLACSAMLTAIACVAIFTGPVSAGQGPKKTTPARKPPIVLDVNDVEVGQVMTSSLLVVHVIRSDNDITYPLIVFRDALDGFFTVRFTTDNCTEPAYIAVNPGSPPSIWTLADLGPPGAIGPTVYVAQPDAALENISLRSFWNVTILADSTVIEGCDLDERDFFAKPAEFLTELNLTPPFRVVLPE